jgi:hypothetical protein
MDIRDLFDKTLTLQEKTITCHSTGKVNLEETLERLEDDISDKVEMVMLMTC